MAAQTGGRARARYRMWTGPTFLPTSCTGGTGGRIVVSRAGVGKERQTPRATRQSTKKGKTATPRAARGAGSRAPRSESGSLTERAVGVIRDRILDLTLAPGQRVDEKVLMERFGLSRTPAREAFNRLATEGLIEIRRHQGAYVHALDLAHVRQFFEAYIAMERLVGFLCVTGQEGLVAQLETLQAEYHASQSGRDYRLISERNAAFHIRLARATENEYIAGFAARLHHLGRRVSFYNYTREEHAEETFRELAQRIDDDHEAMIRHVRDGDNAALIDILTVHALRFRDRIMRAFLRVRTAGYPVRDGEARGD